MRVHGQGRRVAQCYSARARCLFDGGGEHRNLRDPEALWNMLDLTPAGRGTNWYPKLDYSQ